MKRTVFYESNLYPCTSMMTRERRANRQRLLEDWLSFLDQPDVYVQSPTIRDETNYTEDNGITEYFWRTVNPYDVVKDNQVIDQESIYSDEYAEKIDNGQVLAGKVEC